MTISFEIFGVQAAEIFSEMHGRSFKDNQWSVKEFTSLLQGPGVHAMMVLKQQKPAGFVLWREAADEAEILTICILPSYRTKGMASRLLKNIFDKAKSHGIRKFFLEVNENNNPAVMLYEKNSFEIVGRRKDYYGDKGAEKQDALIMKYSE